MPNYNFGMGFQSNPMDAYGEMAGIVRRSRLSKLLGDYYSTGQADIGQLAQLDPETAASVRQEQQKASLGKMLGEAYTADEGKRKQILAQVFAQDPATGLSAAKLFDPASVESPSGWREFDMKARAAGYEPGTPEYENAARIQLGVSPRAVTGAMRFDTFKDSAGRARPQRMNPSTGQVEIYFDESGQWMPLGGVSEQTASIPSVPMGDVIHTPSGPVRIDGVSPEDMPAVLADIQANGSSDSYSLPPRNRNPAPTGGLGVGMSAADEAYAKESASQRAKIDSLGAIGDIEAVNAGKKTQAEMSAKSEAELNASIAKRAREDKESLLLLKEAAGLLKTATSGGAEEMWKGANRYFGRTTEGAKADAQLNVLAGKLLARVPRFEGPQSNIDVQIYQQMAGDLANPNKTRGERIAAAASMIKMIQRYQNYADPAKTAGKYRVGQIIETNGKRYRVTGGDMNDPDVEEVR